MFGFTEIVSFAMQIITWLIYASVLVHLLNQKTNHDRLKLVLVVMVVFGVFFIFEGVGGFFQPSNWTTLLANVIAITFISLAGIKLMISRTMVLVLAVVFMVAFWNQAFIAYIVGMVCYITLSLGFIISAFQAIEKKV